MKKKLVSLDEAINFQIFKLGTLLGRELGRALKRFDITPEKWQVLAALWQSNTPISQTDISRITLKDKPSVSRLTRSMIKDDWIVERTNLNDSRSFLISPTAKANRLKQEIVDDLYSHFDWLISDLNEKDKNDLMRTVKKYVASIEARSGHSPSIVKNMLR